MAKASPESDGEDQSVFVVGTDGMIGRHLASALKRDGIRVLTSTRRQIQPQANNSVIDLSDNNFYPRLPLASVRAAVLCAGVTSMERCRLDPEATWIINVKNTVALAKRLVDAGVFVVFLSSNTVFDGKKAFASASDRTDPQTEYGRQKAQAEEQLLDLGSGTAVVRFSKIISPETPLFRNWASELVAGRVIRPFRDSVMAPIAVEFAVELLLRVLARRLAGITQASASGDMSYEDAARYIAERLGADSNLIDPISYAQAGISFVPRHTTLDASRLAELGLQAPLPALALTQIGP